MKNSKTDKLIDELYENRRLLIRYFIAALIASTVRYLLTFLFSAITSSGGDLLAWICWAIVFYPFLKFFVFRYRALHIYELLRQIIIYTICIGVLWITNKLFLSVLFALSANVTLSVSLGGVLSEILCLFVMWKAVFKKK